MVFNNPSGPGQLTLVDQSLSADEYRIYVGAKNLGGDTLGQGGPGGFSITPTSSGSYTPEEGNQLTEINSQFNSAVTTRGETGGFARWGGALSFDLDAATIWHFDHNTPPPAGANDFLSVAVHEIAHALGLGSSTVWNNLTTGSGNAAYFWGATASALYGGPVPLAFVEVAGGAPIADKGHFREETMSTIFGASTPQEVAMDPTITVGTRKRLTKLDAAALTDLGWTVVSPTPNLPGDFNADNIVDAADYTLWRDGFGGQYTLDNYADWKNHFGQSAPSGTGSATAGSATARVPEPGSAILAFAAIFLALAPARPLFSGPSPRKRLSSIDSAAR